MWAREVSCTRFPRIRTDGESESDSRGTDAFLGRSSRFWVCSPRPSLCFLVSYAGATPCNDVGNRRRHAAVGDVKNIDAGLDLEHLTEQMVHRANTGRGEGQDARLLPC